jgi:glycosyltransferase involved in cell wall biosynthesis
MLHQLNKELDHSGQETMSQVDVIVPCYNYGHLLQECVESVLCQQGVDVRVLILDDASPDCTPRVATELASKDNRIQYRRHSNNLGHIATYNEGLDWAEGDYLVLLSADDLLPSGALGRAVALMEAHPEIGLTFGRTLTFTDGEPPPPLPTNDIQHPPSILTGPEFIESVCSGEFPLPVSVVVRTSLQKQIGGWRSDLPHAGDPEMWLRFAAHAPVGALAAYQGYYRRHRQNMSSYYNERPMVNWKQNNEAFRLFFQQYGDRIPDIERLKDLRGKTAAESGLWKAQVAFDQGHRAHARAFLDAVRELYPPACSWPSYSHLVWKMRLGVLWPGVLRPVLNILRRNWR